MITYIESISFYYDEKIEHYGLQILFKFYSNNYLLFNSTEFIFLDDIEKLDKLYNWKAIDYPEFSTKKLHIKNIKEDELTSYFIEFSNGDIFYIYQRIYGYGDWQQDFEIASKNNDPRWYNEVKGHMNEDWIETIFSDNKFSNNTSNKK